MRAYDASSTIEASPEAIWAIPTDAPGYTTWDSGIVRVEGRIAPGETIKVVSKVNPGRTFPVKVTVFTPGQRMTGPAGCRSGFQGRAHLHAVAPG
jgi:Polyketide cyclase / dehydrase and lipid transport